MGVVNDIANWQFLNEPLYRWVLFTGAMLAINAAWYGVLREMRG